MAIIRAATFNMRHGALAHPNSWRCRPGLVRRAFEQLDVDILALQEVDRFVWRSGFQDQLKTASRSTGMQAACYARTLFEQGGLYGNGLLVRGEISDTTVVTLGHDYKSVSIHGHRVNYAREPRNAIIASIKLDGLELSVAATHLAGSREQRYKQLQKVLGTLACYPLPRVLLGDLNTQYSELMAHEAVGNMLFAGNGNTFTCPTPNPYRQIDHIAVEGLSIHTTHAMPMPVSDHLALVAELAF